VGAGDEEEEECTNGEYHTSVRVAILVDGRYDDVTYVYDDVT